jgi:hypothetical protein
MQRLGSSYEHAIGSDLPELSPQLYPSHTGAYEDHGTTPLEDVQPYLGNTLD